MRLRGVKDNNDGGRSSSGNWSGSSSTRASLDSEHQSVACNMSPLTLRHHRQASRASSNRSLDFDSALSDCGQSVTSRSQSQSTPRHQAAAAHYLGVCSADEGTITPEVTGDVDASSLYSCDAEGYYTSFHIDSGLKTLKVKFIKFI